MPVLVVAMFVVAVCAVTLAHAEPGTPDTCTAAKVGAESTPPLPTDLAAPLPAGVDLAPYPRRLSGACIVRSTDKPHEILAGPRVPRAPPLA